MAKDCFLVYNKFKIQRNLKAILDCKRKYMIETAEKKERFILVGVETGNNKMEESLNELSELLETAGGETAGKILQKLDSPQITYVGKGKIEEIKNLLTDNIAGIICDDELSPAQLANLKDELGVKVLDRTTLILDIFADHAVTKEGKLQVELAQLKYRSSRLKGFGEALSRLGGGIGTRGPGESKLEADRRNIREKINRLKREIAQIEKTRDVSRKKRTRNNIPVVAIVGYTNAGKSTFLNKITDAEVLAENKLFATLDPKTGSRRLSSGETVLFTDTVGFISKLPHNLVEAFKSTLEEAKYADIILHVVDASCDTAEEQMKVVYKTLLELDALGKPVITMLNKQDIASEKIIKDSNADITLKASAKTGEGIENVLSAIETVLHNKIKKIGSTYI